MKFKILETWTPHPSGYQNPFTIDYSDIDYPCDTRYCSKKAAEKAMGKLRLVNTTLNQITEHAAQVGSGFSYKAVPE